jgi:hypothetical protein
MTVDLRDGKTPSACGVEPGWLRVKSGADRDIVSYVIGCDGGEASHRLDPSFFSPRGMRARFPSLKTEVEESASSSRSSSLLNVMTCMMGGDDDVTIWTA